MSVKSELVADGAERVYRVYGQVFFVSAEPFRAAFDFKEVVERVRIDLTAAHFWDSSAVAALDKVVLRFRREGTEVELVGLNEASATIVDSLAIYDKPDALQRMSDH
jgi:SulP family sulfate permease